jgi:cyanophycinase
MHSLHLIGGGWDVVASAQVYGPFLEAAGTSPVIACVVVGDGEEQFARSALALGSVAACEPVPVLLDHGSVLDVGSLGDADGLLVCGGLTPAYAAALSPVAAELRTWLSDRPYAGFSAGSAIAATQALVGGWLDGTVAVCPEDTSEDLEQVTVVDGLGLLDLTVDVHCVQWGTLPRLIAAVLRTGGAGVGIDENTALHVIGDEATVAGLGAVHHVVAADGSATVRPYRSGSQLPWG